MSKAPRSLHVGGQRVIQIGHLLLLLALTALAAEPQWVPLGEALQRPQDKSRLILLYVRAGDEADARTDRWLAEAATHEAVARSFDEMLLVRAAASDPLLVKYDAFHPYAGSKIPRLVILDPAGGVIEELHVADLDFGTFAAILAALRHAAPRFATAAQMRQSGHAAAALLYCGEGLAEAGHIATALTRYNEARERAKQDNDRVIEQYARLAIDNIDVGRAVRNEKERRRAISDMLEVANDPADAGTGARAWMMVGHWSGAVDARTNAYRKAYEIAPKPSPIADSARHYLEMLGAPVPGVETKGTADIRILVPQETVVAGQVQVVAVTPPSAARVEFYLDDARVSEESKAPFRSRLHIGTVPRPHTVKVVAYDANGARLGEASTRLNDRATALGVRIVKPSAPEIESSAEVEVEPRVADGAKLRGVEIFWNDELKANLTQRPFRTTVKLPSPHAFGVLRAVAHDSSGATAEDARLINGGGVGEDVRVDAVEVYALVQDRSGKNVEGLTAKDFVVKEDGVRVDAHLHSTANDPITIGIALDTSSSMLPTMMIVAEYAAQFIRTALAPGDKTLVVTFDESAHLIQPVTAEREKVSAELFDMHAEGATAFWDSIVYALGQLRGAEGKRALLVFSDGQDNASNVTAAGAIAYARESGVPVYVFLIDDSWQVSPTIRQLAEQSAGALFRNPRKRDLPRLFMQVRDDTRGEYLLTFVSQSKAAPGTLRRISVGVPRRGVTVRATSGYYAR